MNFILLFYLRYYGWKYVAACISKKKSTNNFQINLGEKNEILNGSIYHYMIYILISH